HSMFSSTTPTASSSLPPFPPRRSSDLTRDIAVSADGLFVWRYSDRDTVDPNVPDRVTKQKPYSQFGRVTFVQSSQDNTYKALLLDRKSTRLNSSHGSISYAVFCLKQKK